MNKEYLQLYRLVFFSVNIILLFFFSCKTNYALEEVRGNVNTYIDSTIQEDPYVKNFIEPYKVILDNKLENVIAYTNVDLTSKGLSSNLGNILADMVYDSAIEYAEQNNIPKPDFVILNHGGMRVNLSEGDIKTRYLYELMPFENTLVYITLDNQQMQKIFQYMLASGKGHPLSHIFLKYSDEHLESALINNEPFDATRNYVVVTNNYLFTGGDNMDFFQPYVSMSESDLKIRDILIKEFTKRNKIEDNQEQRLIIE